MLILIKLTVIVLSLNKIEIKQVWLLLCLLHHLVVLFSSAVVLYKTGELAPPN